MDYIVIACAALLASGLTLFSGFGLGTLLMPVIAVFLPLDVAIGITALVHLANNLFKLGLLGRLASPSVIVRFALTAIPAAMFGAWLLSLLGEQPPLLTYTLNSREFSVAPLKLTVGLLILTFVALELSPSFAALSFDRRYLPLGGLVSGFFGGLSGHQGAFRSLFLVKAGLNKEQFVATGAVLATLVDLTRLAIYGWEATLNPATIDWPLASIAAFSAFTGAYWGKRLLGKVTLNSVQYAVSGLLVIVGAGLVCGLL